MRATGQAAELGTVRKQCTPPYCVNVKNVQQQSGLSRQVSHARWPVTPYLDPWLPGCQELDMVHVVCVYQLCAAACLEVVWQQVISWGVDYHNLHVPGTGIRA